MTKTDPTQKSRGAEKLARIPIKVVNTAPALEKPDWMRIKLPSSERIKTINSMIKNKALHSVCEEASCPNMAECFHHGTATFMIMGDRCTRRCSFCDVAHGRPGALDPQEPENLAETIAQMGLKFIVLTSVDRDDLRDGGAAHFAACVQAIRHKSPHMGIEILVPDFRGRLEKALDGLKNTPVEVFNHNIETVPRIYKQARPGSDYQHSLNLLKQYQIVCPDTPTKSGIMLGLGETDEEVLQVLKDLRAHGVTRLTLGQYLQPSTFHLAVARYVSPENFDRLAKLAQELGFTHVASGPLVRSSYHAEQQAEGHL